MWEIFEVLPGKYYFRQIGPLKLWIQKKSDEWLVAWSRLAEDEEALIMQTVDACDDNNLIWHRLVQTAKFKVLKIIPVMPDRAVVVKPESDLIIKAGAEALFFVSIPVWIQVNFKELKESSLCELPTVILSNTWFGEPHDGELCYSLKTSARRQVEGVAHKPNIVVCPVQIQNDATIDLVFKRLCLQVGYLNIYNGKNQMWTNTVHIQYRGKEKTSHITFEQAPPDFEKGMKIIGNSRLKSIKGLSRKSFDTSKPLMNY